jgi:hypothetical protein
MKRKNKKNTKPVASIRKAFLKLPKKQRGKILKAQSKKVYKAYSEPVQPPEAKLTVQQNDTPKTVVSYDVALSRIFPQDLIRVIIPNKSNEPQLMPRELVTSVFSTHEISEAGEHAKSINFGLACHSDENGWMFVETMPSPQQPHSVVAECQGKKCVACVAPATHKIIEVVESGEPKKAYLCCYHFCFAVFGKADSNQCH